MKKIAVAVLISLASFTSAAEQKPAETKRVCVTERDQKGNSKETCKTIRVHKKLEPQGTTPKK